MSKITGLLVCVLYCGLSLGTPSAAGGFPDRPIRLIVPNTPGSATDQMARTVALTMQERGGKPVIVEDKPGANGIIAAEYVAKAAADGYTILIGNSTTNAANSALYLKLPYDPEKDFAPITGLGRGSQVMVVSSNFPAKTVGDFITLARTNPGKYAYGSGGASARVATEAFARMAGIKLLHVPYKGNPLALLDLLGGQIQVFFPDMATALPMIHSGQIRPLAVTSKQRSAYLPDVPTLDEAGLSGYEAGYWFAAYAPADTPPEIVQTLSKLMQEGVRSQASASFFESVGMEAFATTPDELRSHTRKEIAGWAASVRAAGIEPE
jgi:tripartite-type tricarboxylate transporter receptor subunit TctC